MKRQTSPNRLKFLTVVWGERYVEEFARVSLPSFMAPGNLPALAAGRDLEILILTTEASRPFFEKQKGFQKLRNIAPVRFIDIDDLVTSGNYGVTLTYAYARGIMDSGEEQTRTTFVFMNADFVLSDGSLAHLLEKIDAGHPAIMAASLRARAEPVLPKLIELVDPDTDLLAMSSREMVGLAMSDLHPTVIGKTVTQNFVSCATFNQLYWQVDDTTLLGRYHLIFMLAITPERPLEVVNSYCDYGFVPEMVPSGQFHVIGDSDEFFMLELAPTSQESAFLSCGRTPMDQIAASLSVWTTREHRNFATVDTIFHANDLPPSLPAVRQKANDFVRKLHALMSEEPISHIDHFYWTGGVDSWKISRESLKLDSKQAQARAESSGMSENLSRGVLGAGSRDGSWRSQTLTQLFRQLLFGILRIARHMRGSRPNFAVIHHNWQDCKLALSCIEPMRHHLRSNKIVIGNVDDPLTTTIARNAAAPLKSAEDFLATPPSKLDHVFIHCYRANLPELRPVLEDALARLVPQGEIALFVEHLNADMDPSNFTLELAQYTPYLFPRHWLGLDITMSMVGGHLKRSLAKLERRTLPRIVPGTARQIPKSIFFGMLWVATACMIAANNVLQDALLRWFPERCPLFGTAALIHFRERLHVDNGQSMAVDNPADAVVSISPERRAAE